MRTSPLLLLLLSAACGLPPSTATEGEDVSVREQNLEPCTHPSGYCDALLRGAIEAALKDGRVYGYEAGSITEAALADGAGLTAVKEADLRHLLKYEKDRLDPETTSKLNRFFTTWNWRAAVPLGYLSLTLKLDELRTLHLRGSNPGELRVTVEGPSQTGGRTESREYLRGDGHFGSTLTSGQFTNDFSVLVNGAAHSFVHEPGSPRVLPAYDDPELARAIDAVLSDGTLAEYEVSGLEQAAIDGSGLDEVERADLLRLLQFESDRFYSSNVRDAIYRLLAAGNWKRALPAGPLDLAADVKFSARFNGSGSFTAWLRFHVRGSVDGGVRLTYETLSPSSRGERSLTLRSNGLFGEPGLQGYLSNEGAVVVTSYTLADSATLPASGALQVVP